MIDELFIYDRDKGLFKEVLKQSAVMQGRYHVSSNYGQDLNSNNLDTLVKSLPGQKYPMVVCLAPHSKIEQDAEYIYFTLLFLDSTYYDSTGQPKQRSAETGTSTHEVWMDWQDMKQAASGFIKTLDKVTRSRRLMTGEVIATRFNIDMSSINIKRLSKFNEDRVSGVAINFASMLNNAPCDLFDYSNDAYINILIPENIVHSHE